MMKLFLSALLLISCAQKPRTSAHKLADLSETVDFDEAVIKNEADNHVLVEATVPDSTIKREVTQSGESEETEIEIDDELPDSESDDIPYSRDFLAKKKTKRMQFWVEYFSKHQRERFQRFINNGEEYRHHIEAIFKQHGLPKELYFVGLIESGYYLGARSHASAVGPWQFIKGTGKRYGLKISHELDERQDLFKASRAAALYFKDLHNIFSSWELALSAYNAGENGIIRRIMKSGTRDFYELARRNHIPSETINYVPKVLAAMHVVNNAEKYGFVIPKKKHRLFDQTVLKPIPKNTSLMSLSKRLNIDLHLLKKLNPELKRNATPRHFAGTYHIRIPDRSYAYKFDEVEVVAAQFISRPEPRKELNRRIASVHRVRRGETLSSVARKYHLTPGELAMANGLKSWKSKLRVGQRLNLQSSVVAKTQSSDLRVTNGPIVYRVSKGDNLTDLARMFNVKVAKIKLANKLKRGKITVGQRIILPDTQKGIYTVKRGDHLSKVAKDLNQTVETLVKLNSLKKKNIYPGQKIIVNID